ncbi:hypothetical protein PG994_008297 [Apiospora phragmitis]|uniref:Uncharacterized protein n=1 Tax=Apiospora phragmitis TaxID=2905665 RepID=A0ABR1USM0_9PEZI
MTSNHGKEAETFQLRPLRCVILCNDPRDTTRTQAESKEDFVLQDWLFMFRGDAYALCVATSGTMVHGIIIHCLEADGPFVSAGTFESLDTLEKVPIPTPPTTDHGWYII